MPEERQSQLSEDGDPTGSSDGDPSEDGLHPYLEASIVVVLVLYGSAACLIHAKMFWWAHRTGRPLTEHGFWQSPFDYVSSQFVALLTDPLSFLALAAIVGVVVYTLLFSRFRNRFSE